MPAESREAMNYVCEKINNAPIVVNIVKNPFYTAILIVVVVMLIMLFVFRNADVEGEDSLFKLTLRTGAYSLLFISAIQFLQNQSVMNELREESQSKDIESLFGGDGSVDVVGDHVDVSGENDYNSSDIKPSGVNVDFL